MEQASFYRVKQIPTPKAESGLVVLAEINEYRTFLESREAVNLLHEALALAA